MVTASAHIITSVIGSGVLSLAWATAQLGWVAGPIVLFAFAAITWYTACLLCDCYRCPGPNFGTRTYNYSGAVKAHLGGMRSKFCGVVQFIYLLGTAIGYTIATPISMAQLPDFHNLAFISVVAAVMSFAYSTIGLGLCVATIIKNHNIENTGLIGVKIGEGGLTKSMKVFSVLQAVGDIAFAYSYAPILLEIEVFIQPTFQIVEKWCEKKWPQNGFIGNEYPVKLCAGIGYFRLNAFRLVWRTIYVAATCVVGMLFPFFNSVLGLLGALAFWPLTLYFPTEMYKKQAGVERFSSAWMRVTVLSVVCLVVSILCAIGSFDGIITSLEKYKPFKFET
ncbi:unnamed protein product [Linum tenue]|uniref:Amino acid transporter transmembrane domain-containing protein n=1 Tax=Linum tenue TaxID=586396 RepID=A0AAV0HK32_9ROSI|nr:unnamed protein product [Linum tenue]